MTVEHRNARHLTLNSLLRTLNSKIKPCIAWSLKSRRYREAVAILTVSLTLTSCRGTVPEAPAKPSVESRLAAMDKPEPPQPTGGDYVGFDRNDYPGDYRLAELHRHFAFAGYWLNVPPGEQLNTWQGKRQKLVDAGFGFLVLANGRLDAEIKKSKLTPEALGQKDAADAIAAARREGFPDRTVLFLDQEEGGRLLPEQAAYFFGWTEAVAASAFRPGSYLSGQPADDGTGPDGKPATITTAQDVRQQIAARHLHPVVFWVAQDQCPPAPGCTVQPPHVADSGTIDAPVWQYAQSPRRPELTRSCAKTYASDGQCYAGVSTDLFLDLNAANSADPSHGRP